MNYEKLLKDHLIKRQSPDLEQIKNQLKRARKDLLTSEAVVPIDLTWSFAIAYHAMIRAGRALMFSRGFLPTTKNSHKTVMEFTGLIFGDESGTSCCDLTGCGEKGMILFTILKIRRQFRRQNQR